MKATRIYRGAVPDLVLPDHLADWDVWDYWERERYDSMAAHIPAGGMLWVIGAEHGAMAALWSRLAARVVLVEPSPEFWPNIRMTWEANDLPTPAATVQAFAGAEYSGGFAWQVPWPACAAGDVECPAQAYRYLHEPGHVAQIPTVTLDGVASMIGRPDAVSIDIEGAEVLALAGASELLASGCQWWVSVHPDLIERDYSPYTDRDVYELMTGYGYVAEHLATDHETHVRFYRP